MKKLISVFIFLCVVLLQAGFTNAADVEIFGISNDNEPCDMVVTSETEVRNGELGSTLYRIDYKTGSAIPVGPIGYHDCQGLDFHPATNELYATCFGGESHNPLLLDINPNTGEGTVIVELQFEDGFSGFITDISFRADATLFVYVQAKPGPYLAIINPNSGQIERLGSVGLFGDGNAIAMNAELYNVQTAAKTLNLNVLNQSNGSGTFIRNLNVPPPANNFPIVYSMDKDVQNNDFYAALDDTAREYIFYLVTIDVDSGEVDLIGETVEGLQALAVRNKIVSNVPTLSEYGLIALVIVMLAAAVIVIRQRKQSVKA